MYVEDLFLLNFLTDFLVIFISKYILRAENRISRIFLAALLGGVYAPLNYAFNLGFLKIPVSLIMILIAFNNKTVLEFTKSFLAFYFASFTLAGASFAISNILNLDSFPLLAITFGAIIITKLSKKFIDNLKKESKLAENIKEVEIKYEDKSVIIRALLDTGNESGRGYVSLNAVQGILPADLAQALENFSEIAPPDDPRIILCPYHNLNKGEILPGVNFSGRVFAITKNRLSEKYDAII